MPKQHFFIGSQYLGSCTRSLISTSYGAFMPKSLAFFCPECGEVWARALVDGVTFSIEYARCAKHPHPDLASPVGFPTHFPGSLWKDHQHQFTNALPPEVLQREFLIHLNYLESTVCPAL